MENYPKYLTMEKNTLDFARTLQDAFVLGVKNAPSIFAAYLLWLVTLWIPYINVGTTIALTLLPVELPKQGVYNPLTIFHAKWRRYMGEFFMTIGLQFFPLVIAFLFLYFPGIVLAIAWSLSFYFLIEKDKNPVQAIKASNDATYGSKWTIFFASLVIGIFLLVVWGILMGCCILIDSSALTVAAVILCLIFTFAVSTATSASIWLQLRDNVE